ncbi:PAS domain S-box protein [Georgfuchsia toluolica]|nr:PAS domain S-box protein [Georgfuchsia toluolica]
MAPSSALLLILLGAAVFSTARTSPNHTAHLICTLIGSSATLIALLLFVLSYQGMYLDAEHLGFAITGTVDRAPLGHMSPITALCFLLAGSSLVAVLRSFPDRARWAMTGFWLAALLALVCIIFLLAYLIGTPLLYGGKFIPPALTSIIALAALSAALLAIVQPQAWTADRQINAETRRASRSFMLVFLLMALGLVKVGSIYYEQDAKLQRAAIERELSAVADLKVSEIVKWHGERLGDAALLYGNPVFADLVRRAIGGPRNAQARDQLLIWLRQIQQAFGYTDIHLIDAQGVAQFSIPDIPPTAYELETARNALLSVKVSLDDFRWDEDAPGKAPRLTLLVPLLDAAAGGRPLGIVMLEIDPGRDLYPLIERWPTQSPSAETLLVRRDGDDVLYLNELRYRKNTTLSLRYPLTRTEKPAVKAVLGQEGIVEGTDFRGTPIIAVTRKVPGTPWFLIVRMDKNEFLASIQRTLWQTASLIALTLLSAGMALGFIGRQQRMRHYAERTRVAEALASSAARYQAVIQTAADAIVTADSSGIIVNWNTGAERMFGYAETEVTGQPLTLLMPERFQERHLAGMRRVQSGGEWHVIGKTVELTGRRKDASEFPLELALAEWTVGEGRFFTGNIRDITERKAAEAKILRQTHLYAALSQCNEAIVRCTSEEELFSRICRIAVQFGGMNMAWIGIVDSDILKVRPAASFGDDAGFLSNVVSSMDDDSPFGLAPIGTTFREGRPYWCQDLLNNPVAMPWREYIARHKLAASASLPLHRSGVVIGAFVLCSSEASAFDEEARQLLIEMATDISFALDNFDREVQRNRAELALVRQKDLYDMLSQTNQTIVRITNREELFPAVCRIAVEHGRFRFAWIGLIEQDDPRLKPVARYGADNGYIDRLNFIQDSASLQRKGLTGQTILSGAHVISNDFLNDSSMAPWHEAAQDAGVCATAKFPIRQGNAVIGAINLYADDVGFFTGELVATLDEMAVDVSFALDNYAREAARRKAEEALREGEEHYRRLFEANPHPMWVYDTTTLAFLAVNDAAVTHYGWSREEFQAMTIADIRPPEDIPSLLEHLAADRENHFSTVDSLRHRKKDGTLIDVEIATHLLDFGGQSARIVSAYDITERKRAEDELRASEERFRGLVEQSIAGIYIIQDDRFAYVNPRFAAIRGFNAAEELIGQDPMTLIAEKDRSSVEENNRRLFAGEKRDIDYSFTALRKDGSNVEVGIHSTLANYRGRPAIIGMLQDISEKKHAEEAIQHYIEQLKTAFMSTVQIAMTMSEMRDPYTAGHERRVAEIAVAIGAELGFDAQRLEGLRVAGSLHDIGKITIPSEILSKPGKLSALEYQMIQGHPQAGYDVLKDVEFPWPVAQVALQHHERVDGSGYPQGLKGEAILFEARIMAVADVVEAMSSHRPYRPGLGIDKALAEIERGRGTSYDPAVADACLKLCREKDYKLPA